MAKNYSAHQYDSAYGPKVLQNWEIPRQHQERPIVNCGFTESISDEKGRLLPGVPRSKSSPWGHFVGTWDMPLKIPGNKVTIRTGREDKAADLLLAEKQAADKIIYGTASLPKDKIHATGAPIEKQLPKPAADILSPKSSRMSEHKEVRNSSSLSGEGIVYQRSSPRNVALNVDSPIISSQPSPLPVS